MTPATPALFLTGLAGGLLLGCIWSPRFRRRRPRRSAPLPYIRMTEGRIQRGNGHGGPQLPRLPIAPRGQRR